MPTITQLEYVVALDQCRHFGRAAAMCHVSQPTLSTQLQKLEDELGVTLFDRTKQPVLPTEDGKAIIEQATIVLNELRRLELMASQEGDELEGEFKLGIIPTIAPFLVPLFLDRFTSAYPRVELFLEEQPTASIIESLDRDRLHAGIVATPLGLKRIEEEPLYYEPLSLYVGPESPMASLESVREKAIPPEGLWLLSEEHCLREQVIVVCGSGDQRGSFPSLHMKGGSLETVIELVSGGDGYTLLPQMAADSVRRRRFEGVVVPIAPPTPAREVSLIHRRGFLKQRIVETLKATIDAGIAAQVSGGLLREKTRGVRVLSLMGQFR